MAKDDKWIQKAFSKIEGTKREGKCTGKKYGSKSCPPGSKAYNMAKSPNNFQLFLLFRQK